MTPGDALSQILRPICSYMKSETFWIAIKWRTGHWAIILWSLDTFLIFHNFLRFLVLSRSAPRIYHVYK